MRGSSKQCGENLESSSTGFEELQSEGLELLIAGAIRLAEELRGRSHAHMTFLGSHLRGLQVLDERGSRRRKLKASPPPPGSHQLRVETWGLAAATCF